VSIAEILQPKFIFVSNAYVFDGRKGNYHEDDIVLPSTVLGKAKLSAENFVKGKSLNYVTLRTSCLYGRGNGSRLSFFDQIRIAFERGKPFELSNHYLQSYAPVSGFTEVVERLIENPFKNKTMHYGGLTRVTAYDFARMYAERFGYDPELVAPKAGPDGESQVDYSLNSSLAVKTLKIKPLLLEEGFDLIEKNLVPGS
jgi:dTDP-4-dehydrorhamnose reductase